MRATIFTAIYNKLAALSLFQGSNGTLRVYKYAKSDYADGYPAASITHGPTRSQALDTSEDLRTYTYHVRIAHERTGNDLQGHDPETTERVMGEDEDTVLAAFDSDNDLGVAGVVWTRPVHVEIGYIMYNKVRVMDITLEVNAVVTITK